MADTPEGQIQELMDLLFNSKQATIDSFGQMFDQLGTMAGEAGLEAVTNLSDNFLAGVELLNRQFSESFNVGKILSDGLKDIGKEFLGVTQDVKSIFEGSGVSDMLIELGIDPESMRMVQSSLGDLLDKDFAIRLGVALSTQSVADNVKAALAPVKAYEDKILKVSKAGEKALRGMLNPLSDDRPFADLTNALGAYRNEIIDAVNELGIAPDKVRTAFEELSDSGLAIENIRELKVVTSESGDSLGGLQAALLAAKATGLSTSEVADQLNMRIRTLGTSAEDAGNVFEILQRVQANTTLSIQAVSDAVGKGQKALRFFGDTTESSATIFRSFIDTLGRGREELARPLFDAVIGGIQQLANSADMGTRAFIGMATGIGGPAGPIGAGLRVEEALTTGEGLEEVLEGVRSQIEQLSGAPLLTRSEAIDTGQEQQFEIQRRLLQQFLGVQGAQQQNLVLEALQQSDFGQIRDQLQPTGGGLATGLGRDTIAIQEGAIGMLTNRLDVLAQEGATEQLSADVIEASKGINLGAQSFSTVAENLRMFIEGGTESLTNLFERIEDRGTERIEEEARADVGRVFDTEGPLGPVAESLNSFASSFEATGVPLAEGLNSLSSSVERASAVIGEGLNTAAEVRARTGVQGGTELNIRAPMQVLEEAFQDAKESLMSQVEGSQDTASRTTDRGATTDQKEVTVTFKAEMDPSGFINLVPTIQEVARPIAREEAEATAGRQSE